MRHYKKHLFIIVLLISFLFTLTGCEVLVPEDSYKAEYDRKMRNLIELIEQESFYFHDQGIRLEDLYDGILYGIVDAIDDPYSVYMNEEEFKSFLEQVNQNFAGIGVQIVQ